MEKLTQEQLDEAIALHGEWLSDWSKGKRLNLSCKDLSGLDFTGANLTSAILVNAKLIDAILINVNLNHAILNRAIMIDANLTRAIMTRAIMTDANLTRAIMTDVTLEDAILIDVILKDANLTRAIMIDVILKDANLTRAIMTDANLTRAIMIDVILTRADLTGTKTDYQIEDGLLQKVAQAALASDDALDMRYWHTCDTTHCIAGWACHLAENGKEIERKYGTQVAGLLLLGADAHSHFFDTNEEAREYLTSIMEDLNHGG
jgi:uncharacterized protein YjbI with pentapeptide repeats